MSHIFWFHSFTGNSLLDSKVQKMIQNEKDIPKETGQGKMKDKTWLFNYDA